MVVGLNHRTAAVELRERLAIPTREIPSTLAALRVLDTIREAAILSTCNRVEYYVVTSDPSKTLDELQDALTYRSRLAPCQFMSACYVKRGEEVVAHLFRVAAGLDSMILGEPEIAAQVKQAYTVAHLQGTTGPLLNQLFQRALHAAREVRARTAIGQGQASIGSVVVGLGRKLFGSRLAECEVLLWGAGKAGEATARHLIKEGVRQLSIVNRTEVKAQDLASLCQGGWVSWEQARGHLARVDIAIVCTQAPHYVIDRDDLAAILPTRHGRPLCLIDLAVPRNVDPALKDRPGVLLYNIDDLQTIAQTGLNARAQERPRCESLIASQVDHFLRRCESVAVKEGVTC